MRADEREFADGTRVNNQLCWRVTGVRGSLAGLGEEARVAQSVRAAVPAARLDKVRRGVGGTVSARRSDVARVQVCRRAGDWSRDLKGFRTEVVELNNQTEN